MEIAKIKLSEADKELLKKRIKELDIIGLRKALNNENFLPTQDAMLNIEKWLFEDKFKNTIQNEKR